MTSVYTANTPPTSFSSLYDHLKTFPTPLLPPGHSYDPKLTDTIASLYLHPTIESLLHILNHDLPSAHFLARKMESAPAYEGMYIHGILHRVEGDYNNCLAWYADVCCSEAFEEVWGPSPDREFEKGDRKIDGRKQPAQESARAFIAAVRTFKEGGEGDKGALERESRRELETVMGRCVRKFGTGKCEDATQAWVKQSEEIRKMQQDMTSGDKGRRHF